MNWRKTRRGAPFSLASGRACTRLKPSRCAAPRAGRSPPQGPASSAKLVRMPASAVGVDLPGPERAPMTITKRPLLALRAASAALLSVALAALVPAPARSEPLEKYTGYTRPGYHSVGKSEDVRDVQGAAKEEKDDDKPEA